MWAKLQIERVITPLYQQFLSADEECAGPNTRELRGMLSSRWGRHPAVLACLLVPHPAEWKMKLTQLIREEEALERKRYAAAVAARHEAALRAPYIEEARFRPGGSGARAAAQEFEAAAGAGAGVGESLGGDPIVKC